MKKFLSILMSAAVVSGSVCALAACVSNKQPAEQVNNMTVKSVTQNAYGSVNVTVDVSGVDFSDNGNSRYYYIQPSLDGGQNWYERTAYLTQSEVINGEFSFSLADYASYDGNYYLFGNQEEGSKLDIAAGDTINISLRFKAYENYLVSEATQPVEYVLKDLSIFGAETDFFADTSIKYGEEISGTPRNQYIFEEQSDKSLKIKKVTSNAEVENEITEADPDILTGFEYKLILLSDYPDKTELMYFSPENYHNLSGWQDYNPETGVTREKYNNFIADEFDVRESYDENNNLTGTTNIVRKSVAIMVRQKETSVRVKSLMALTYYVISDWTEVGA